MGCVGLQSNKYNRVAEKIYHIFQPACNVLHVRKIKAGRFLKNEVIFQLIFQPFLDILT